MSYKRESETSYALGATVCIELLKSKPNSVVRVILSQNASADLRAVIESTAREISACPVIETNDRVINSVSKKGNCFVACEFKKFECSLDACANHIVLVNPSDSGNLGNIFRTAAAFGVNNVGIITPSVDAFDPKTVRASMGAAFLVNFQEFSSFNEYLKAFGDGRAVYPFMLGGSRELSEVSFTGVNTLVFGNEATGLSESFLKIGTPVRIAQSKTVDSLNLTTAVAIAAYKMSIPTLRFQPKA